VRNWDGNATTRLTLLSRRTGVGKIGEAALGRGCLPPFERLLKIVQRTSDLVGEVFALFAENDVLVIRKRKVGTSTEALPQKHGGDMFDCSGVSHTSFDGAISLSNTF
jgi:hypothetical protein